MKSIIILIGIILLGISAFAQNSNSDPQISINNYKHPNKALKATHTDTHQNLTGQEISLRSQRTNKIDKRNYMIVPSNTSAYTNVQGMNNKANYKSQF